MSPCIMIWNQSYYVCVPPFICITVCLRNSIVPLRRQSRVTNVPVIASKPAVPSFTIHRDKKMRRAIPNNPYATLSANARKL